MAINEWICYTKNMKEEIVIIHSRYSVLIAEEILCFIVFLSFITIIFIVLQLFYIIIALIFAFSYGVQMVWIFKIFLNHIIVLTSNEFTANYFITKSRPKLSFVKQFFYPYHICKTNSYQVLDTFTLKYEDIKEYGYIFDLKVNFKYARKRDIGFITQEGERFHINLGDYRKKDLIYFINLIYKKTNKYPLGCLKDVLEDK